MLATRRLRLAPEWDGRFTRMVMLSGVAHVSIVLLILALAVRGGPRPLPMVAYTVEITDPSALGGRLPPGKISTKPTADAAAAAPPPGEPAAPEQPSVPEPPPSPPAPEPEPVAKAEPPKPEPPQPEAVKIEPAKKPEPPKPPPKPAAKPEPKPPPPKPVAEKPKPAPEKPAEKPPEKPAAEKPKPAAEKPPAEKPPQAAKAGGQGGPADADAAPKDAYSAAAERWRTKSQGQGLGGTDGGSGPIGTGGQGPGGGGQLVGIEFLAYRQTVINTVKGHWTNVVGSPGLVAAVRFAINGDGTLGGIRLERSSGNAAYDASALRAVQRTQQLPPPPAKYAREFGEFVIEFHSEESGGRGSG
jgi:TonB family protein